MQTDRHVYKYKIIVYNINKKHILVQEKYNHSVLLKKKKNFGFIFIKKFAQLKSSYVKDFRKNLS